MRFVLPLAIFLGLAIMLGLGLQRDPRPVFGAAGTARTGHRPPSARRPAASPASAGPARPGLVAQCLGLMVRPLPAGAARIGRTRSATRSPSTA